MLKFGQKEVMTKDFYGQRQVTDIFTIDVDKVVASDKVACNNGKDCCYIVGYQVDGETIMPLFIKTPKNILSYGVSKYDKNSAYTMSFNVSVEKRLLSQYKKMWNEVESQLFEKMATEPIKIEGRYVYGKLKTWKERIKTNFHGQDVPYDIHCNATSVLKIDSVYKQGKNYYPQLYGEECKYADAEKQHCSMLSDDDDGFSRCKKKAKKIFVTCLRLQKLIINEQDVFVRTCKKVEYTSSKLHENKGRA